MYVYIMTERKDDRDGYQRTQIYLTARETSALDALAGRTGRTRSQLIREAIDAVYLRRPESAEAERALRETAGAWRGRREDGASLVEKLRGGRLAERARR